MDLCRICLFKTEPNTTIFGAAKNGQKIADVLIFFASIQIEEDDDLPIFLCPPCENKLNEFIDFQTLIQESDIKLKHTKSLNDEDPLGNISESQLTVILKEEEEEFPEHSDNKTCEMPSFPIATFLKNEIQDDNTTNESVNVKKKRIKRKEKNFPCPGCDKSFRFNYELVAHSTVHTGSEPFRCEICKKGFVSKHGLKAHVLIHSTDRPFECKDCGKGFKQQSGLLNHRKLHHENAELNFSCEQCGKSFRFRSLLLYHSTTHETEKSLICEICGKGFSHPSFFARHVKDHNKGDPKVQCVQCGKTFANRKTLAGHMRIHFSQRPYGCDVCHKRFTYRMVLNNHMKIHNGVKDYECKICEKKFRFSSVLYRHMRVHSGETPYRCEFCEKTFPYKHHMLTHVKKQHSDVVSTDVDTNSQNIENV